MGVPARRPSALGAELRLLFLILLSSTVVADLLWTQHDTNVSFNNEFNHGKHKLLIIVEGIPNDFKGRVAFGSNKGENRKKDKKNGS